MISRRRLLSLACASVLLAACGSNTGRGGNGQALKQWYHAYGEPGVRQAVERYAKAYTKTQVSVQWNPGDYDSKLATSLLSDGGPDVFESTPQISSVRAGQLVPLDDVFGDARSDFSDSILATHTVDGKIYGVPQAVDMQMLFYRKSFFSQAGVQPPSTVDELIDVSRRLTAGSVKGLFAGNDGGGGVLGGPALWSTGLDYVRDHQVGFDDPLAATAIGKLRELYTSGSLLLGAVKDWAEPDAFTQGLVAMQWTGLWAVPAVAKALGDDFGVLPFPSLGAGGSASVPVGAFGAMVNAKSKRIDEAKDFVRWLWIEKTDYQEDFNLGYGFHIPPRKSISERASKLTSGAAADAVKFVRDNAKASNPPDWTSVMRTAFNDAVSRVVRDGAPADAELRAAADVARDELKRLYG
ncbi:multiple sugar transport system substrate-binding protein [Lentzea albidocapillata subsp. violacea]|uniref:Multiple sugar transport system substrate-binding protein n=1 Tax=Lentzea albidocapillata subsp. violacea TaxID=128104 RepID=A0A1G9DNW4_9PSEU|nr:sugar ABC transporter substrate-binding protein [Lentzea albidocapillata]SDK65562.1 multiple sugar transport system substrate-binding protein [Lentzea albidocapillata subsp. violacea]